MTPASLIEASSSLLAHLIEPALRSLLLGGLAGLALSALRIKGVSVRLAVWKTVLYAALAMPLLGWLLPPLHAHLPLMQRDGPGAQVLAFVPARAANHATSSRAAKVPAGNVPVANAPLAPVSSLPVFSVSTSPAHSAFPWKVLAAGLYLLFALIFLLRLLLGVFLSRRLLRASQSITDAELARRVRFRADSWGLENPPRLAESPFVSVPATLGIGRPVIILPADWREWDAAKLGAVLAHEISHVARRDALTQRLALLHRAIFWFSPLGWWLVRRLTQLAEEASDEAALSSGADRARYAETLLGFFATLDSASGRVWWRGISMAAVGRAEKRVERIFAWKGATPMRIKKSLAFGLAAIALPLIFIAAAVHPVVANARQSQAAPPAAPQPPAPPTATPQAPAPPAPAPNAAGVVAPANVPAPRVPANPPAAVPILSGVAAPEGLAGPAAPPIPAPPVEARPVLPPSSLFLPLAAPLTPPRFGPQEGSPSSSSFAYGSTDDGVPFAIVSGGGSITLSGSFGHFNSNALSRKVKGPYIWFMRDGKAYIIQDPATINRARQILASSLMFRSVRRQVEEAQRAMTKAEEAQEASLANLKGRLAQTHINMAELRAELKQLGAQLEQLSSSTALKDASRIQEKLSEVQGKLGELQARAMAQQMAAQRAQMEKQMAAQKAAIASQLSQRFTSRWPQMKSLLDDALARGLAKPAPR